MFMSAFLAGIPDRGLTGALPGALKQLLGVINRRATQLFLEIGRMWVILNLDLV
jgi:hypothetical protein